METELSNLRYQIFAESPNFHQFEAPPEFPLPPVDLTLGDDDVSNSGVHEIRLPTYRHPWSRGDDRSRTRISAKALNQREKQRAALRCPPIEAEWKEVGAKQNAEAD